MNTNYFDLINEIDNIKDKIQENNYILILNIIKDIYQDKDDNRLHNDVYNYDELYDEPAFEIDYEKDIVYANMFKEYVCVCDGDTYESQCCNSFLQFRYCNNYQKIINKFPDIHFIMKLVYPKINCNHKIIFSRNIQLDHNNNTLYYSNRFINICKLLIDFTKISKNYIKKYIVLILFNYFMKNFYYAKSNNSIRCKIFQKIIEVRYYDNCVNKYQHNEYLMILNECNESFELLDYWLNIIKKN